MSDTDVIEPKQKQVIQQALQDPMASMKSLLKNNLFYFMKFFWDQYSNDPFKENWHIELICKELEKIARRVANYEFNPYDLVVNVPPGTTKTATVMIFFPVWCWVNWYWMKFVTASHSHDLALESAEYSRDLVRSEKFQLIFPEIDIKQDKDTKSNFRVIMKNQIYPGKAPRIKYGGNRLSFSVKGGPTGYHGHIILWDDLIDPKKAVSEVEMKNANDFLDQQLSTRKTDKLVTATVGIMQRLHQNDPTGHLIKSRKSGIRHICLPGEIKTEKFRQQVKPKEWIKYYKNGLLDTVRLSEEALKKMEIALGPYGYAGQVGQYPAPPKGGMFKVDNFEIIESLPNPVGFESVVRYWDKAGTAQRELRKNQKAAYTAGVKIVKLKNGKFIVTDVRRGHWADEERERTIKNKATMDRAMKEHYNKLEPTIYIEQEPGSGGKDSAQATVKNLAGFSIYPDHPTGDKVFRAGPWAAQVNEGNVMLLKGDWNYDYIEEHRFFPFGTYKDQVDASSAGFAKLNENNRAYAW